MGEFKKRKVILYFTDCEGTIAKDGSYDYDQENLFNLLDQLAKLEKITGAEVKMHLISPTSHRQMAEFMQRLDSDIRKHYLLTGANNPDSKVACEIENAGAYYEYGTLESEIQGDNDFYTKISNLNLPKGRDIRISQVKSAKEEYVSMWVKHYQQNELRELLMPIYSGNGEIDVQAIKFINSVKNGYSICPSNSVEEVKNIANFASDKRCIMGVTEGLEFLNKELEKRMKEREDSKRKEVPEGEEPEF